MIHKTSHVVQKLFLKKDKHGLETASVGPVQCSEKLCSVKSFQNIVAKNYIGPRAGNGWGNKAYALRELGREAEFRAEL